MTSLEELLYDVVLRSLERQEREVAELDDIRERNLPRVVRLSLGFRRAAQILVADLLLWISALAVS